MVDLRVARPLIEEHVDRLFDALVDEGKALQGLQEVLEKQRTGVAENDRRVIEESVPAIGRTLLTLDEARRCRVALVAYLTGHEDVPLSELLETFNPPLPDKVRQAHRAVRETALNLRSEVAINKHIIDQTLQIGDRFLQRLFTESDLTPHYDADSGGDVPAGGVMVNRQA